MPDATLGPAVSIVMPVWNPRPDWLREAVDSALGQRDCDLELIVVDNGNVSPVAGLLADVRDSRVRIVRIEHGGVSRARNAGLAVAHGQFVRFADCDDVLEVDSTRRLLDLADDLTIAYGATEYCDAELRGYKTVTCSLAGTIGDRALTDFTVMHPAMLFPRRIIDLAGPWDETLTICEDWDYVQRALEQAVVRGSSDVALRYRRHSTSAVGSASIELSERSAERVVEKYVARHPDQRGSARVRRAHAMRLVDAGERYLQAGDRSAALVRFARALRMSFSYSARQAWRILRRELGSRLGLNP